MKFLKIKFQVQLQRVYPSDLQYFSSLEHELKDLTFNYRILIESAEQEVAIIERDFNAELLSRTGFVFQEIKDIEYETVNELAERSETVGSQECIVEATERLGNATLNAGTNSMATFRDVSELVFISHLLYVHPSLSELSLQFLQYNFEPLAMLGNGNPVANIYDIINYFYSEINTYSELFEQFIDQIIRDMQNLDRYHAGLRDQLNESLEETRSQFVASITEIRERLVLDCD